MRNMIIAILMLLLVLVVFLPFCAAENEQLDVPNLVRHENVGPPSCRVISYYADDNSHRWAMGELGAGESPTIVLGDNFSSKGRFLERKMSSGVFINNEGYILTNAHGINTAPFIEINGRHLDHRIIVLWKAEYEGILHVMEAQFIASGAADTLPQEEIIDLAVIKVRETESVKFPAAKFAIKKPYIGQQGIAITAPFGLFFSVTPVNVAAIRSGEEVNETLDPLFDPTEKRFYPSLTLLQLNGMSINMGSSGGPEFGKNGELTGIITAILQQAGIVFAISAQDAVAWIKEAAPEIKLSYIIP